MKNMLLRKMWSICVEDCSSPGDNIEHISGYSVLSNNAYLRHNQIQKIANIKLAQKHKLLDNPSV